MAIKKIQKLQAQDRKDMQVLTGERHDLWRVMEFERKKYDFFDEKLKIREIAVPISVLRKKSLMEIEKRHREELITEYGELMRNAGDLIGQYNANDIIKIFIEQEVENVSLFKYANELNYEVRP